MDVDTAVEQIVQQNVEALIVDNAYLVAYDIVTPWYSNKEILVELLVLRIGEGSEFSAVTDLLDDIADTCGVKATHVGSAFSRAPQALARKYRSHGFVTEDRPSLIKWR